MFSEHFITRRCLTRLATLASFGAKSIPNKSKPLQNPIQNNVFRRFFVGLKGVPVNTIETDIQNPKPSPTRLQNKSNIDIDIDQTSMKHRSNNDQQTFKESIKHRCKIDPNIDQKSIKKIRIRSQIGSNYRKCDFPSVFH